MKIREISVSKRFVQAAAVIFVAFALAMLLAASKDVPPLRQVDPLFGVRTRTLLLLAGIAHLLLGAYLFAARDLMRAGAFILWAALNHWVYRAGLLWLMKTASPLPVVVAVSWACGISSRLTDLLWQLSTTALALGAPVLILIERRRLRKQETEDFLKHWRETHGRPSS